ncbi:MAG: CDP-glucose 4,6-dehydratase [Pseudobdellovibrio sp.]
MVSSFWKNKKVFLTGHTGFKGSWASLWLLKAGANLTGYSLGLPTNPSLFDELKIADQMNSIFSDVRDLDKIKSAVKEAKPEIIIHMAAQPLVRYSYQEPVETYMTNVMGTVHLFEAARAAGSVRAILNVTSDKCYENKEQAAGYTEDEAMGGHDPYSNSKGCSELVTSAYRNSFFKKENIFLGSGRAGNVIGGGDWAGDRLVPDIIRSVMKSETLQIRNPRSTRPWQHVLEPVGGYLQLAEKLYSGEEEFAEGFNFGPASTDHCDVEQIILKMNKAWKNKIKYQITQSEANPHEAHYLSLNCEKANQKLKWQPKWNVDTALQKTVEWVENRQNQVNVQKTCLEQILEYEKA